MFRHRSTLLFAFLVATLASPAQAHVRLLAPNGGETLDVGSTFTIRWRVLIAHNTQNWDLWYATTDAPRTWIAIATDLAPGDASVDSEHAYEWVIPDAITDLARVRVRMDNSATDYQDISNADFSIVPASDCSGDLNGDGNIDLTDLAILLSNFATPSDALPEDGDLDGDGDVDLSDLAVMLSVFATVCP